MYCSGIQAIGFDMMIRFEYTPKWCLQGQSIVFIITLWRYIKICTLLSQISSVDRYHSKIVTTIGISFGVTNEERIVIIHSTHIQIDINIVAYT